MTHQPVYLKDYQPSSHCIETVDLTFELDPEKTIVTTTLKLSLHSNFEIPPEQLFFNGEDLKLIDISIDGNSLDSSEYHVDEKGLTILKPKDYFEMTTQVEISPLHNTHLQGLYVSGDILCTQNEPEGFRRMTYFLDRPDILSVFTTTLIADKSQYPVLLSNGNLRESRDLDSNKHLATWHDPTLKPCYLYALVAGDLGVIEDTFTTKSLREVELKIYCDHGDEKQCEFAMDCLKRSMKWDEEVFGCEYDLDMYLIVAVHSFNMGAMENKGLNIFNSSCVHADPLTATDTNFLRVETVICHEYFHNWTGNRITLRDWFQLTLKEGLTVFRDQEFSSDMHDRDLKRMSDIKKIKAYQFPEDRGPTTHPPRPTSYIQINNFYTTTIYDKGAEIIRMLQTLVGREAFLKAMSVYFERFDGQAITTDDFLDCFETTLDRDLKQFSLWYSQNGLVQLNVDYRYNEEQKQLVLNVKQSCKPMTSEISSIKPFFFPLKVGLLGLDKSVLPARCQSFRQDGDSVILEVSKQQEEFVFENVSKEALPIVNQGFSAPVELNVELSHQDLAFIYANEPDMYSRNEAKDQLVFEVYEEMALSYAEDEVVEKSTLLLRSLGDVLIDTSINDGVKAEILKLPSEAAMAERQQSVDFEANHAIREKLIFEFASSFRGHMETMVSALIDHENYELTTKQMGQRSLWHLLCHYLSRLGDKSFVEMLQQTYESATNMTTRFNALSVLNNLACQERENAFKDFEKRYQDQQLVMYKWLSLQVASSLPNRLGDIQKLMHHQSYDEKIPNSIRAVVGMYGENIYAFHTEEGAYKFLADQICYFDDKNRELASRLCKPFKMLPKLMPGKKQEMKEQLKRILEKDNLSNQVYEIISKTYQAAG